MSDPWGTSECARGDRASLDDVCDARDRCCAVREFARFGAYVLTDRPYRI